MMRLSLVLLSLLVVVSTSWAQSDLPYQLRVPTADEYLAALPAILDQASSDYDTRDFNKNYDDLALLTAIELRHYGPLSDWSYASLTDLFRYYANAYLGDLSKDILTAWLRENPVDLDDYDTEHPLRFDTFVIGVTQRDFNNDGRYEWLLDINHDDFYRWQAIMTRTAPGQYREIKTPLVMFDASASYTHVSAGFSEELAFKDLNQDGLPEWVIAIGGIGGGHQSYGFLQILQWQDGQMIDLAAKGMSYSAPAGGTSLFPAQTTVDLHDVDDNGIIDIQIQQRQDDTWGCTWLWTRVYDWQDGAYALLSDTHYENEVQGCAWRAAETAMWAHDYQSAITYYERGLTLPATQESIDSDTQQLRRYALVRLALAYALADQHDQSQRVLDHIAVEGSTPEIVQEMADSLQNVLDLGPSEICQALYDVWDTRIQDLRNADYSQYTNMILPGSFVGFTYENVSMASWLPLPDPNKAGCDMSAYGPQILAAPPLTLPPSNPYVSRLYTSDVLMTYQPHQNQRFLIMARFYLMQIQQGIVQGDEWMARYLFATALRVNNRPDEALEQYVAIYENAPLKSWQQLAGLYLMPLTSE